MILRRHTLISSKTIISLKIASIHLHSRWFLLPLRRIPSGTAVPALILSLLFQIFDFAPGLEAEAQSKCRNEIHQDKAARHVVLQYSGKRLDPIRYPPISLVVKRVHYFPAISGLILGPPLPTAM